MDEIDRMNEIHRKIQKALDMTYEDGTKKGITPKMIAATAEVIQGRAGDEWTTIDWAISIAEAALEAAFAVKD